MRTSGKIITMSALAAMAATSVAVPADARTRHHHHYYGKTAYHYRTCRHSSGGTGLIVGGVAGAVAGPSIIGHGLLGGAVAGRAIDRTMSAPRRCRTR